MRHLDLAAVTVGDAAAAADIPPERLSAWLDKRIVRMGDRDKAADGSGDRRLLSLRTAHAAALTATIALLGVRHNVAGRIAHRAVANPAAYARQAFIVAGAGERDVVIPEVSKPVGPSIVIDATAAIKRFDERLAARVPELRSAGLV